MEINITLVIQLVLFLTALMWLSKFLFTPLIQLFDEREARTTGMRREAEEFQKRADEKLQQIEARLKAAQKEGRQLLEALKAEGLRTQTALLEEARREAAIRLEEVRKQIAEEADRAREELKHSTQAIADLIAEKATATNESNSYSSTQSGKMECAGV